MSLSALDVLSGTLAGWAVTAVGHPFETIKLRLQTQPSPPHAIYKSGMDAARQTLARDGIKGFYVGVASPIAGQTIFRSALFAVNGAYTRARLAIPGADGQKRKSLSYVEYAAGGSIAWSICTLIECPINVAATQLQVQTVRTRLAAAEAAVRITATIPGNVDAVAQSVPQPPPSPLYRGVAHYLRTAPAAHGLRASLFVGLVPHALRNAIGGALHFGAFEATRRTIAEARGVPVERVGLATNMFAGSIGGILFWSVAYPVDVVKGAMQGDTIGAKRRYKGTADAVRQLWAEAGPRRFTRGFAVCLARAVPANAALLATAFTVQEAGARAGWQRKV